MGEEVGQRGMDRWGRTTHLGNGQLSLSLLSFLLTSPTPPIPLGSISVLIPHHSPDAPREQLIAPLALSALPPCHGMPIAAGTHFKQSMAGVAKQSSVGLTVAAASAVNARGFSPRAPLRTHRKSRCGGGPFPEYPVSSPLKMADAG